MNYQTNLVIGSVLSLSAIPVLLYFAINLYNIIFVTIPLGMIFTAAGIILTPLIIPEKSNDKITEKESSQ